MKSERFYDSIVQKMKIWNKIFLYETLYCNKSNEIFLNINEINQTLIEYEYYYMSIINR